MPNRLAFQLLVFDWDGTLMDSTGSIAACMSASFRDCDLDPPADGAIRSTIGLGLDDTLARLAPSASRTERSRVIEAYRRNWFGTFRDRVCLFDGAQTALETLARQGYDLAVATGKGRRGLDHDLEATGLEGLFLATRTADEAHSKPHPQMLLDIMSEVGTTADRTLVIGDTTYDLMMAQAARVAAIGVLTGSHKEPQLIECSPLDCLSSVRELPPWLHCTAGSSSAVTGSTTDS